MLSAIVPLLSLLATAPSPAAVTACVPGTAIGAQSCDLEDDDLYQSDGTAAEADATDEPRYATPAVIDCRVLQVPAGLQALVGECDGTPRDASYRTSRDPDSERAPGGFGPGRRERAAAPGALAACAGVPGEGGAVFDGPAPSQPIALYALPDDMPRFAAPWLVAGAASFDSDAELRLLERPPRA